MTTKKKTTKKPKKAKKTKLSDPIATLRKLARSTPGVIPFWAKDPVHRTVLQQLVRAGMDFQKTGLSMVNRKASPTMTNPAVLAANDLKIILAVGDATRELEDNVKGSMQYFLQQSEIGLWLMDQPGLKAGWLAAYVLAEFPDVYDAGRCNKCNIHLERQADMTYVHQAPPERKDGDSKDSCEYDGMVMEKHMYWMHEKKPSSFVQFCGLATEEWYKCPLCGYQLSRGGKPAKWAHPTYKNLPKGITKCILNGKMAVGGHQDIPRFAVGEELVDATPSRRGMKREAGKKTSYKNSLRAKLLGKKGVADAFIMRKHPKYYELYAGVKHQIAQKNPNWSAAWIDRTAKRKMINRFVCDFFIKWRETEQLVVRPPYEEEKLGIKHHDNRPAMQP